jgi:aminopeptidase N
VQRVEYVSGPMRDFVFALGSFETKSRAVQDTVLNTWVLQEHAEDSTIVLSAASGQFEILSELVGPYPYSELDIVDAPGAFGGIEYPGLVFVGTLGTNWIVDPTVHEVAHQWFYGLIGDDQLCEPWLDEALATYSQALYLERTFGVGRATGFLSSLRAILRDHPASGTPIGLSVGEYATENDYGVLVYYKGALFIDALRHELGDRKFNQFLQAYFQRNRYGFVSTEDFQDSAEEVCSCNLDALFDLWVYEGGDFLEP